MIILFGSGSSRRTTSGFKVNNICLSPHYRGSTVLGITFWMSVIMLAFRLLGSGSGSRGSISVGVSIGVAKAFSPHSCSSRLYFFRQQKISKILLSSSSSSSSPPPSSSSVPACPLPFETLPYQGAAVRLDRGDIFEKSDYYSNDQILEKLQQSIAFWKENDYTSAWLHVPASKASLIESLQKKTTTITTTTKTITTATSINSESSNIVNGNNNNDNNIDINTIDLAFDLHHVNTTENTIVLKKWLREGHEDKIPPFATHQVGCAGFVLSDDNELLLVKEWSGSPSNRIPTTQWKLPGGLLDIGETFGEASCREVYEETGVECEFESILAFWHRHGLMFGKSDFYYVCLLSPKKGKELNIDPVEVSDAIWMPIQEFLETQNHPLIHHVLKNVYHLDKETSHLLEGRQERLEPVIEMLEGHVQFGDRAPFLTYTGRKERNA